MPTIVSTKVIPENIIADSRASINWLMQDFISTNLVACTSIDPNDWTALIFTSQNAIASLQAQGMVVKLHHLPVYCVGEKTKEALELNGFEVLEYADYASELILKLPLHHRYGFICGNLRRDVIPDFLNQHQIIWKEFIAYATELTPIHITEAYDAILFFSPSAVESFSQKNEIPSVPVFSIGTTTATALKAWGCQHIVISDKQTVEDTVTTCVNYFNRAV